MELSSIHDVTSPREIRRYDAMRYVEGNVAVTRQQKQQVFWFFHASGDVREHAKHRRHMTLNAKQREHACVTTATALTR